MGSFPGNFEKVPEIWMMGKTLKVLVMSALASQAPWPARQMSLIAWSIVAYSMEKLDMAKWRLSDVWQVS